ncbi:MAG TPA: hypothetical protein VF920_12260 [Dongiaceae bacterium]
MWTVEKEVLGADKKSLRQRIWHPMEIQRMGNGIQGIICLGDGLGFPLAEDGLVVDTNRQLDGAADLLGCQNDNVRAQLFLRHTKGFGG